MENSYGLNIKKSHLKQFQSIIDQYGSKTKHTKMHYWKSLSNNELWLWLVGQIMVVGSSAGNDRFQQREDLKAKIDYDALQGIKSDFTLRKTIHKVLRGAGVRYASADIEKCHKSKALLHNYRFISSYNGGFKGLLEDLAQYKGKGAEFNRVNFLMKHLKFIKCKSARDFLMSMGMNRGTLAIDIRIQNIFKHLGINFPTQAELARPVVYNEVEREIIEKVCMPLNIDPVKFDRTLYQNYQHIIKGN